MFKTSKKTWLLLAFLMLVVPSLSEIFKPATSFHLEDSLGGKVKLSAIPLKTDLLTKVQLKDNKLKVSNEHDQLTIKLKIKVDKDLQHYEVEKDEDSSECSKEENWESKDKKDTNWKETSTVTTIVKPEVKLNPVTITKIVEKLPIVTATGSKVTTTSLPIITSSSSLAPSTFTVTSTVQKEAKGELPSAKKDEKNINNVLPPIATLIKPAIITVGKSLEDIKSTPVLGLVSVTGSAQITKEEPKQVVTSLTEVKKSEEKDLSEKKISSPETSTIKIGQSLPINNVIKPSSLSVQIKPIEVKKEIVVEKSESKVEAKQSVENSESDVKKPEAKAVEIIKSVTNSNAGKIVVAESVKSDIIASVKPEEKIVKPEEKLIKPDEMKESLPINNAINPKDALQTLVKPAVVTLTPTSEAELKRPTKEEVLGSAPIPTVAKKIFADTVNPFAIKKTMFSEQNPATVAAPISLVHPL